jgi:hypothetical protein
MTDTPPPKRRFWQIHLSTAVVIMLTVGLFSALNFSETTYPDIYEVRGCGYYGWPLTAVVTNTSDGMEVYWSTILMNAAIALSVTLNVAFISEYIARRSKP